MSRTAAASETNNNNNDEKQQHRVLRLLLFSSSYFFLFSLFHCSQWFHFIFSWFCQNLHGFASRGFLDELANGVTAHEDDDVLVQEAAVSTFDNSTIDVDCIRFPTLPKYLRSLSRLFALSGSPATLRERTLDWSCVGQCSVAFFRWFCFFFLLLSF